MYIVLCNIFIFYFFLMSFMKLDRFLIVLFLFSSLFVSACSSSQFSPDHKEDSKIGLWDKLSAFFGFERVKDKPSLNDTNNTFNGTINQSNNNTYNWTINDTINVTFNETNGSGNYSFNETNTTFNETNTTFNQTYNGTNSTFNQTENNTNSS